MKVAGVEVEAQVIDAAVAAMRGPFERCHIARAIITVTVAGWSDMDADERRDWADDHPAEVKRAQAIASRLIAREAKAGTIERRKQRYGHIWVSAERRCEVGQ